MKEFHESPEEIEELYQAFKGHLEQNFKILVEIGRRVEISGGFSGARTFLLQIERRLADNTRVERGTYILKVSHPVDAEREEQGHLKAKESSLGRYIPDLIDLIRYDDIPLTGILYQIAGESLLMRTTLQKSLAENYFPHKEIEKLADVILSWNLELNSPSGTSDLLESIRKGLGEEHLNSLLERLGAIVEQVNQPRIDLHSLENATRYNPIHSLLNLNQKVYAPLREIRYFLPEGRLHGDLHPGNVIIPMQGYQGSFNVIDFASSRVGNAFFDLAYLELSILLNSSGGFHRREDLENWWKLENYLISDPLPSEEAFPYINDGLRLVLPIRRALWKRIEQDRSKDNYWVAFLAASVEAGLDLARKAYRDPFLQRVAFLTAVSRFHCLVNLLEAIKTPLKGPMATIHWPGEGPLSTPEFTGQFPTEGRKAKIELVWPGEISTPAALYDPWKIVEGIWSTLTGENDQGVLLLGERKFGKSSFFNSIYSLFPRKRGNFRAVRIGHLNLSHSVQSFATQLLANMCRCVDLQQSPVLYESSGKDFDTESFLSACVSVEEARKEIRFVIFVDEIDNALSNASSKEDATAILQLLSILLTDPDLPIRLLLTGSNIEVLRSCPGGTDFIDNLGIRKIPLCSEFEMKDLIERFDVPIRFEEDALNRIFYYSGGEIYLVKLAVKASIAQASEKDGRKIISARLMDDLMHAVIEPTSSSSKEISDLHEAVFRTMSNIYERHFSAEERRFMQLLTKTNGVLRASSLEVSEEKLANVANILYRRGYISKTEDREDEVYSWRIGIWQLFLENRY